MEQNRKQWIDALRAIAMLIVMTWHFSNDVQGQWVYSIITAPIMIPLFFAITGYVFNDCNGDCRLFYKKLFYHLVIPWIVLAVIKGGTIAFIRHSMSYYVEYLCNLFTGENLWYFPCCIIAEILHFHNLKWGSGRIIFVVFNSLLFVVIGLFFTKFEVFHNLSISTAFICQMYILIGFLIRSADSYKIKIKYPGLAVAVYVGFCVALIITPPPGW